MTKFAVGVFARFAISSHDENAEKDHACRQSQNEDGAA